MGFLSDLFKQVKDEIEELEESSGVSLSEIGDALEQSAAQSDAKPAQEADASAPCGDSWGDEMPAEENQYSYSGNYIQYFEMIFREDFPEYAVSRRSAEKRTADIFTFTKDSNCALICELMPESSEAKKLREDCRKQGIPYVRFYYDHDGWWNTRSYVVRRIKEALGK